jgi:hypothetical protein
MVKARLTKLEKQRWREAIEIAQFYERITHPRTAEDEQLARTHGRMKRLVYALTRRDTGRGG